MPDVCFVPEGQQPPESQIGASLESLSRTIANRRHADEGSYTYKLLSGKADELLKKIMEEAGEVALAGKDLDQLLGGLKAHKANKNVPEGRIENMEKRVERAHDHLRYEAGDVVYHLLVVLERYGIGIDELAAELNSRMTDEERPRGGVQITEGRINRDK